MPTLQRAFGSRRGATNLWTSAGGARALPADVSAVTVEGPPTCHPPLSVLVDRALRSCRASVFDR
jgi:hypothetical protein